MEILEIIEKLVGKINPVGESHIDTERYENLKVFIELTDRMISAINTVAHDNRDAYEHSKKEAMIIAKTFIDDLTGQK